jgi:NAD(P)H-hydrate repair Nnr-like enzyme with NAD(P)H-hydrate epimerase domain
MQKAGEAAANFVMSLPGQVCAPILVVAGPGNNGGDACETAANLSSHGYDVSILLCANSEKYSPDALFCFEHAIANGARVISPEDFQAILEPHWHLIIDGLFGIGLTREITGVSADIVAKLNSISSEKYSHISPRYSQRTRCRYRSCTR